MVPTIIIDDATRAALDVDAAALAERRGERFEEMSREMQRCAWLDDVPVVPQKSEEWLLQRHGMITASDLGQAIGEGHYGTAEQLCRAKSSAPEFLPSRKGGPLDWGTRYEDVVMRCYLHRTPGGGVREYGLIPHRTIPFFGASPDGVRTDSHVMVEIKSPMKRVIDGTILPQYLAQVQGQLETCDLRFADFVEGGLDEYRSRGTYLQSVAPDAEHDHGCVVRRADDGKFEYSPEGLTPDAVVKWVDALPDDAVEDVYYWRLHTLHVKRLERDRSAWNEDILPRLTRFWDRVEATRRGSTSVDAAADMADMASTAVDVVAPAPRQSHARRVIHIDLGDR